MLVFGLTGGIAAGKSSVEALLAEAGIPVLDADLFARQVVEPGSSGLAEIVERFGGKVLSPDGSLDRKKLGQIIFFDRRAKADLEAITHPRIADAIRTRIGRLRDEGAPAAFVSAALMVETGSWEHYTALVVVECSDRLRVERLMERDGLVEADAQARLAAQLPQARKVALADFVVSNSGQRWELEDAVRALLRWVEQRMEEAEKIALDEPPPLD